jgi:hypothetical protein
MPDPNSPVWLKRPQSDAPIAIAAISPLASWSDKGMPAMQQYSSVRRGSKMRRKIDVAGDAAGRDDHRPARADHQPGPFVVDHDTEH